MRIHIARPGSAFAIAVSIGMPCPTHAADDASAFLTFNGRPLSRLRDGSSVVDLWLVAAPAGQPGGQITGVLLGEDELPLPDRRVELDRPSRMWEGRLVTTKDADGMFSYVGLDPGQYEVQYRVDGRVVATSGSILLTADARQTIRVRVSDSGAHETSRGWSNRKKAAIAAGAVLGAVAIYYYYLLAFGTR